MSDVAAINGVVAIITIIISSISTVLITRYKNRGKNRFVTTLDEEDLKLIHSNRVDLTDKLSVNGRVYKTRKFDRVRSPMRCSISIENGDMILTGSTKIIRISGITPIVSNGVIVNTSEDIAIVSRIESNEGKLFVSIMNLENDNSKEVNSN